MLDELLYFAGAALAVQADGALADAGDEPALLIAFGYSQCNLTTGCWHLENENRSH